MAPAHWPPALLVRRGWLTLGMALRTVNHEYAAPRKGRGAAINPEGRFEKVAREAVDDGWNTAPEEELPALKTRVTIEHAKSII